MKYQISSGCTVGDFLVYCNICPALTYKRLEILGNNYMSAQSLKDPKFPQLNLVRPLLRV